MRGINPRACQPTPFDDCGGPISLPPAKKKLALLYEDRDKIASKIVIFARELR
jgi:hypothetical protein